MAAIDERTTLGSIGDGGRRRVGFGTALIAVFLAGVVTKALMSLPKLRGAAGGNTPTLLVATFAGILISAVAIKVILSFMDVRISLTAAVVTVIVGSLVSLLITAASTPARLNAEGHAAHATPVALPFVSFGFNALGALLWIAAMFGQALIIQNFSTASE